MIVLNEKKIIFNNVTTSRNDATTDFMFAYLLRQMKPIYGTVRVQYGMVHYVSRYRARIQYLQ
jgi:hypothetical protein